VALNSHEADISLIICTGVRSATLAMGSEILRLLYTGMGRGTGYTTRARARSNHGYRRRLL
jgi:hypothetical protein